MDDLDHEIRPGEVRFVIRKLKTGKASGHADILAEIFKVGQQHFVDFLTTLLVESFEKYRNTLSSCPFIKKGAIHCVDTYRGVSLWRIVCKLYTPILNSRLYNWEQGCGKKK